MWIRRNRNWRHERKEQRNGEKLGDIICRLDRVLSEAIINEITTNSFFCHLQHRVLTDQDIFHRTPFPGHSHLLNRKIPWPRHRLHLRHITQMLSVQAVGAKGLASNPSSTAFSSYMSKGKVLQLFKPRFHLQSGDKSRNIVRIKESSWHRELTQDIEAVIKVITIKEKVGRIDTQRDQHCFRSEGRSKRGEHIMTEHPCPGQLVKVNL